MKIAAYSSPGSPEKPNEDYFLVDPTTVIVLDGATARTDTGCIHGAAWFATRLGNALKIHVNQEVDLVGALGVAIEDVAQLHQESCDLTHPGTPSAAVAIVSIGQEETRWLLLGDATLLFETPEGTIVKSDQRGRYPVPPEQAEADKYRIGDPRKDTALRAMKRAELATRNTPDGFWVAAADSAIATRALTGTFPNANIKAFAAVSDGAARAVDLFHLFTWEEFTKMATWDGPQTVIDAVRKVEEADPVGDNWPRNKASDDATVVTYKC
ncbi:protein phosphatase 2C domain-containing protein [Glycomyces sp. TRM65418]|uniref:protein phosphatase 2C domain-containing protein n=1 Tax=Glycomyces sp. TRM65418 TaxID=2867006 RepID=UPI001CE65CE0|nr:protein phosphatase 2C domain-containing protein [Glycomyces sp. TRM65418]MCC3765206.1 protein phosphatase 2C domain-containing protein [Glycomyces sp. TRM65418]QZD54831.1 protein phosphatase 2C domain-containing protein [Glycomyces sp. TRM65418]